MTPSTLEGQQETCRERKGEICFPACFQAFSFRGWSSLLEQMIGDFCSIFEGCIVAGVCIGVAEFRHHHHHHHHHHIHHPCRQKAGSSWFYHQPPQHSSISYDVRTLLWMKLSNPGWWKPWSKRFRNRVAMSSVGSTKVADKGLRKHLKNQGISSQVESEGIL